jgi:type IV pilus assembly protein PilF
MRKFFVLSVFLLLQGCLVSEKAPLFPEKYSIDKAVKARAELASRYLAQGDVQRAKIQANRAMELDDKSPEILMVLGLIYQHETEWDVAEDYFKKAIHYGGDNFVKAKLTYSDFLVNRERSEEACELLQETTEILEFEQRDVVYEKYGDCLRTMSKTAKAVDAYNKGLLIQPANTSLRLKMAEIYYSMENYSASIKHYKAYVAVAQHSAKSLWLGIRLARIFKNRDDEGSYSLLLKEKFPESNEYAEYIKSITNQ